MSSDSSNPSDSFTGLPPELVGEIAKWYLVHVDNFAKDELMDGGGYTSDDGFTCIGLKQEAIPQLNKMLWSYTIMRLYAGINIDLDILYLNRNTYRTKLSHRNALAFNIYEDIRLYKYFIGYKPWAKETYHTREAVMTYIISSGCDRLFLLYYALYPEPYTKEELEKYLDKCDAIRIYSGVLFKYEGFLRQKLKEITG
jgi:hypothetical protein